MLSPFQKQYPDDYKETAEKLEPNLYDKEKYSVHYRNLQSTTRNESQKSTSCFIVCTEPLAQDIHRLQHGTTEKRLPNKFLLIDGQLRVRKDPRKRMRVEGVHHKKMRKSALLIQSLSVP